MSDSHSSNNQYRKKGNGLHCQSKCNKEVDVNIATRENHRNVYDHEHSRYQFVPIDFAEYQHGVFI